MTWNLDNSTYLDDFSDDFINIKKKRPKMTFLWELAKTLNFNETYIVAYLKKNKKNKWRVSIWSDTRPSWWTSRPPEVTLVCAFGAGATLKALRLKKVASARSFKLRYPVRPRNWGWNRDPLGSPAPGDCLTNSAFRRLRKCPPRPDRSVCAFAFAFSTITTGLACSEAHGFATPSLIDS